MPAVNPLLERSDYVRELRPLLPETAFEPARSRVLLVPLYYGILAVSILAIWRGWVPRFVAPVLSIVIGCVFACLTFVAHEALHGGIVRGKLAKSIVGWLGFLPFAVSPRLWVAWHGRVHHATANFVDDPDTYPDLAGYRASAVMRFVVDQFSLGGRRLRGTLSLFFGFTGQSTQQIAGARRRKLLTGSDLALAYVEYALGIAVWVTLAILIGFVPFLFAYVLPILVGNAIIMAFILTNHGLSPRVDVNDPLVNSLSVTTTRFIDFVTLNFGLHVEHHVFPAMSSRHSPLVRDAILSRWPERYQSMPIGAALVALHRTSRVYQDGDPATLVNPRTGEEFPTLVPRATATLPERSAA
jgi:fatty acid desaturase